MINLSIFDIGHSITNILDCSSYVIFVFLIFSFIFRLIMKDDDDDNDKE